MPVNFLIIFSLIFCSFSQSKAAVNDEKPVDFQYLKQARFYLYHQPDSAKLYLDRFTEVYNGSKIDSLYAEMLMLTGIYQTIQGDNSWALTNFERARSFYLNTGSLYGLVESVLNIGEVLYNQAEYDKALTHFNKALKISREQAFTRFEIRSLNYVGKYHHSLGDFDQSFKYYMQAYVLARQASDTLGLLSIQNKIGKHYETLGNYPKALEYYLQSEELSHHINNRMEKATTYNSLGNIYHLFQEYEKSRLFHSKALRTRKQLNYQEGVAKSLNNLGEVLIDMDLLDSARLYLNQSLDICQEINYPKGSIKSLHNQGVVYQREKKMSQAIGKYNEALGKARQIGYNKGILGAYHRLASMYKAQDSLSKALAYCNDGLKLAIEEDVRSSKKEFYLILSEISKRKGDDSAALRYFKNYVNVKDEMVNMESNNRIAELKAEYELSMQSRANEVLKKDNEIKELMIKRKNMIILFGIITCGLLLALVGIFYSRFIQNKRANKALTLLNNSILAKNKELDSLNKKLNISKKQQTKLFSIISHELRNPLFWFRNLIQMLSDRIDSLDKEMLSKSLHSLNESATNTFHLMDNLLYWSRSQLGNIRYSPEPVLLADLVRENIQLISHYALLKHIKLISDIDSEIMVMADKAMIRTVIRNLVSNAVKYTPANGHIKIVTRVKGDRAIVEVSDSGAGLNVETIRCILNSSGTNSIPGISQETGSGLGLALSKEFIEINGGTLKAKSEKGSGAFFSFDLNLAIVLV
jgi:signal transduction histidine kinase